MFPPIRLCDFIAGCHVSVTRARATFLIRSAHVAVPYPEPLGRTVSPCLIVARPFDGHANPISRQDAKQSVTKIRNPNPETFVSSPKQSSPRRHRGRIDRPLDFAHGPEAVDGQAHPYLNLPPSRGKRPEGTFAHRSILCNLRALCRVRPASPRPEPVEGRALSASAVNHSLDLVSSPVHRGLKSLNTMSMTVSFPSFSHSSACSMAGAISLGFSTRIPWPPWAFA